MEYSALVFPLITLAVIVLVFARRMRAYAPKDGTLEWIERYDRPALSLFGGPHPMVRRDWAAALLITAVYAVAAFIGLGVNTAPQSFWQSGEGEMSVTVDMGGEHSVSNIMYYTGLYTGGYTLELSEDSVNWSLIMPTDSSSEYGMPQLHSELFKWQYAAFEGAQINARYIRITASDAPLALGEMAVYDSGALLDASSFTATGTGSLLFDEQSTVPDAPSYLNSAYFDEIYHARTAYEHYTNVYPYEITHPPLGKLIIMLGIELFGMTPFGWRFMGTLFGVLMLLPFYVLLKNMFGSTKTAVCGTLIFAFDFMHFVQTRMATIDTYPVFFIILSYLFMYRYICRVQEHPFGKTAGSLMLSGLFFGLGCASKWTGIYAGLGLAALYTTALVLRGKAARRDGASGAFAVYLIKTLAFSVLAFLIVPAIIYCLSYIPYGLASGMSLSGGMLWDAEYYKIVLHNQSYMWNYHSGIEATHSYSSTWYMWIADARPILYYLDYPGELKSAFAAFNNPLVSWCGLFALIGIGIGFFRGRSKNALFIIIGYLSQLLPWVLVPRLTFAYHYFPSTIFLVLAICCFLSEAPTREEKTNGRLLVGLTIWSLALFVMFYPVLTGVAIPASLSVHLLKWFPSWPFG